MFGLFGGRSKGEIRRLNKDAPGVIDYAYQSFRTETVRDVALLMAEHLDRVEEVYGGDPLGPKRAIVEYESLHKEARRRRDDVALTAFTLMLIYQRAEVQGEACQPARDAIKQFMADWAHTADDADD